MKQLKLLTLKTAALSIMLLQASISHAGNTWGNCERIPGTQNGEICDSWDCYEDHAGGASICNFEGVCIMHKGQAVNCTG